MMALAKRTKIVNAICTLKDHFDVPCVQDYVHLYSSHHGHLNRVHLDLLRRLDHDQGFDHLGVSVLDDVHCLELVSSSDIIAHRTCCRAQSQPGQHRQIGYLVPVRNAVHEARELYLLLHLAVGSLGSS
jgi:hypothetical protein